MATINCLRCGVSNRSGSNYCNNCGAELPGANLTDPTEEGPPPTPGSPADEQSASMAEGSDAPFQQPWLISDEPGEPDEPAASLAERADGEEANEWQQTERLITGIQGLLEPNALAAPSFDDNEEDAKEKFPPTPLATSGRSLRVDDAELRQLRHWLSRAPAQSQHAEGQRTSPRHSRLFLPLLFLLLGIGLALPILLEPSEPTGIPHAWPGVSESFDLIRNLPAEAKVLTYWAYDPATAGEMDFVAHPVLTHLVGQGHQLVVASPLPGGPQQFLNLLEESMAENRLTFLDPPPVMVGYLPGGATVLPLLGYSPDPVLPVLPAIGTRSEQISSDSYDLALVVTDRAEDAQMWLEQVQPRNGVPVLVVSSAGADPVLRPYWQSGQISGLVSGFDGAGTYWSLLSNGALGWGESDDVGTDEMTVAAEPLLRVRQWMVFQNWGHLIFILMIVLGNLAGFMRGRGGDGTMPATDRDSGST